MNKSQIDTFEALIRQGKVAVVKRELSRVNSKKIPRPLLHQVANLALRSGAPNLAIRLLRPIVRSEKSRIQEPTSKEVAEYIFALNRLGMVNEGLRVAKDYSQFNDPKIQLYKAYCHVVNWDNRSAINSFLEYLSANSDSEYQVVVVKLNLASSYLAVGEFDKALSLLSVVVDFASKNNFKFIHGNALELSGQAHFFSGQHDLARRSFEQSRDLIGDTNNIYAFFSSKWLGLLECERSADLNNKNIILDKLRQQARQLKHWESIREMDLYKAKYNRDVKLFEQVYFGTPSTIYRSRSLEIAEFDHPKSDSYIMGNDEGKHVLDLRSGLSGLNGLKVKPESVLLKTLQVLTRDFYRPQTVGALFNRIYNDEYYDPLSSPNRIYKCIQQLRDYSTAKKLEWDVKEKSKSYMFHVNEGLAVKKYLGYEKSSHFERLLLNFRQASYFTAKEVADTFDLSLSTATRMLNKEIKANNVVRERVDNKTMYRISP